MEKENFQIEVLNTQEERGRFHQDPELLYILEGAMELVDGESRIKLPAQGIYVVNGSRRYSFRGSRDILFVRMGLPTQLVCRNDAAALPVFWCDSTREDNSRYDELRGVIKRLLSRYLSLEEQGGRLGYLSLWFQLLDLLSTHFLLRSTDRDFASGGLNRERMEQIDSYINANYARAISSKELADKLYLSQGYLSRFFKKNYSMSFAEHLTEVRLHHVVEDLLYTSIPVTHIAYENGFSNMAAFNKAFREKYGQTPSAMRKQRKELQAGTTQDPSVQKRLETFLRTDGGEGDAAKPTEILAECPISPTEPLRAAWGDTINIGAAADLLKSEVREHLAILTDTLHFRYARFWNLFSKEMLIDPAENRTCNFSRLDTILDALLGMGLKPHIELGVKPRRLYRTVQAAIVEETAAEELPHEVFRKFLSAMMRHLLRRYRRSELNTWRVELWFPEGAWGEQAAAAEYYAKFEILYQVVREYAEEMEVGGCGIRIGYMGRDGFEKEFLNGWARRPVYPDFVSFLCYAYRRGEIDGDRYSRRSMDNENLAHVIHKARGFMEQAGFGGRKLYVTEWNLSISDRNYINDSCFKGAYILKNALDTYGQVDLLAYFLGSDSVSEHYDSDGLLYGGCGLLSKDGVMKAAGYAFRFLSWLYPHFAGKGENYLVTTDRHDSYAIVCHNQKMLNHRYYLSREDEIQRESIWKYLDDRDALALTLRLTGVADGAYQVKTYQINEQAGDALQTWGELGYERELSRNDIQYLKRMCGPKLTIQTLEAQGGVLPLHLRLEANEIRFVRVRRLG